MNLKRNGIISFVFLLLVFLKFSSVVHAQDAAWTEAKATKQLEFDLFNLGINYHHQLGKSFSLRMHASAGPIYYWGVENENPKNGAFFIPYVMAELRWYPGHKRTKDLKWNYTPLDGFYTHFVSSLSFNAPERSKGFPGNWGFPNPIASLGLGYQHRFLKYGFVNLSAQYGLVYERYYISGFRNGVGISHGPTVELGAGFILPLHKKE
ncbi:MAG: hypothetical protein ACYC1Q_09510 [Bacteroidia bacterium]